MQKRLYNFTKKTILKLKSVLEMVLQSEEESSESSIRYDYIMFEQQR